MTGNKNKGILESVERYIQDMPELTPDLEIKFDRVTEAIGYLRTKGGVYLMKNSLTEEVLYVGVSLNLGSRLYVHSNRSSKYGLAYKMRVDKECHIGVGDVTVQTYFIEGNMADVIESVLINKHLPKYNSDGVEGRGNSAKKEKYPVGEWGALYIEEEKSMREISREYGVSPSTVRTQLIKSGVCIRNSGEFRKVNIDAGVAEEMYIKENKSLREIGKELGCGGKAVGRILKDAGVELDGVGKRKGSKTDSVSGEKCADLYTKGKTLKEIGEEFGISAETVRRKLLSCGCELRDAVSPTIKIDVAEAHADKVAGMSNSDLATKYGCHYTTVNSRIKEYVRG